MPGVCICPVICCRRRVPIEAKTAIREARYANALSEKDAWATAPTVNQMYDRRHNLDVQIAAIENAEVTAMQLRAMKQGNQVLHQAVKES